MPERTVRTSPQASMAQTGAESPHVTSTCSAGLPPRLPARHFSPPPRQQRGAALIVGLVLLLVMTLLAVTGVTGNTLELAMAGNQQFAQDAFEAAESAIQAEMTRGPLEDIAVPRVTQDYQFTPGVTADATTTYTTSQLPPPGYSISEYQSDHYEIDSTGVSARSAASNHIQGFYVVVPSGAGNE